MWEELIGIIPNLVGALVGGSKPGRRKPPEPKPEFQPLQRQPMQVGQQPINFDTGATGSGIDPNDTRLQAIASLRGKLGV